MKNKSFRDKYDNLRNEKKKLTIAGIAIVAFAIIFGTILFIIQFGAEINYNLTQRKDFYYVEKNDLYKYDKGSKNKIDENIYSEDLTNLENVKDNYKMLVDTNNLNFKPIIDEKKDIYINVSEFSGDNKNSNIVIKSLKNKSKISTIENIDLDSFKIDENLNFITYLKKNDDQYELYKYNLSKNDLELISKNTTEYYANNDLDKMYYISDNDLYDFYDGKSHLIATNSFILKDETDVKFDNYLMLNDFNSIYFGKYIDDKKNKFDIYKKNITEDKYLIESEVISVPAFFYNNDYFYFEKEWTEPIRVSDYVIDDISDGSFDKTEPRIENYNQGMFFFMPDYFSYYQDKNAFDSIKNYINKNKDRIDLYKKQIDSGTFTNRYNKIYYFDNGRIDSFCDEKIKTIIRSDKYDPYIFFEMYQHNRTKNKKKLSEIIGANLSVNTYMRTLDDSANSYMYLYHKNTGCRIENLNQNGEYSLYQLSDKFLLKCVDGTYQSVYSVEYKAGEIVKANLIGRYLTNELTVFASLYIKDIVYAVKNTPYNAYLYHNGQQIESLMNNSYFGVTNDLRSIIYYSNYNDKTYSGTLNMFIDGQVKKIADSVLITATRTNSLNSEVYYISDLDLISFNGKLNIYNNIGKNSLVTEYASNIINYYEDDIRNSLIKLKDDYRDIESIAGGDFGENYLSSF